MESVDLRILAHLELAALALYALPVVSTVPGSAHPLPQLKTFDTLAELNNVTDDLVTRYTGEDVSKVTAGNGMVGKAHTTSQHFDKHLIGPWVFKLDISEFEGAVGFVDYDGLVGFG